MSKYDLSQIWPEWQIEGERLGAGSFGEVFKAVRKDSLVESSAAVKIISIPQNTEQVDQLRSEYTTTEQVNTYLQSLVNGCVSEIQLMESLKGIQNIVSVEDYKVVKKADGIGWDIYIRMELLTPLTKYIEQRPLSELEVIKLGCDICSALEVCGKKGIVHRDIKPENIFVNSNNDFKLGDFGIARKLEGAEGHMTYRKGSPNYMAPEVANSKDYDARVDLYSLGIVLYRYLNKNRLPFMDTDVKTTEDATIKRLHGEKFPPPSDASDALSDIVMRACAYNPKARYQNASHMKAALQDVLNNISRVKRKRRRGGKVVATIAAVLVLLGGTLAALHFTGVLEKAAVYIKNLANSEIVIDSPISSDDPEIKAFIDYAEVSARTKGYADAIAVIQDGLAAHPNSDALNEKLNYYTSLLQEQRVTATLADAQALADAQGYEVALAFLQDAINQQGELPEYVAACEKYQTEYLREYRDEAIAQVNTLAESGNYLNAVSIIDEIIAACGEDKVILELRAKLEVAYVSYVVSQVDSMLITENYDVANTLVNDALQKFPGSETLIDQSNRIKNARPVYLMEEVTPYKKPAYYNSPGVFRMSGENYLNGFTCMGYGEYNKGNQVYFNLDGQYSMISFTAGIVADRGKGATFLFHADGELVYKCTLRSGDKPSNHVFNIVGCKQFKVSVYDGTNAIDKSGIYGLANIVVTRNVSAQNNSVKQLSDNQVYLLDDMKPYKTASHYQYASELSMGGQKFANGFSCMGYGDNNVGNKIYFNLDGKYSQMTFTAGIVLDLGLDVMYRFYKDGELAYELKLREADLATTHSINVEGCKQLLICVYDKKRTADVSGTYGIAEIIMEKSSTYEAAVNKSPELKSSEYYLLDVLKPHTVPSRYDDSGALNMGGNHYSKGFSCMGYGDYNKGNRTYFALDGKYKQISFTAGIILDRELDVTFRFLADGKEVYKFTMSGADLPTEHSFSVEGCSELVVCVYDRQRGADSSGTYGLANIIVTQ